MHTLKISYENPWLMSGVASSAKYQLILHAADTSLILISDYVHLNHPNTCWTKRKSFQTINAQQVMWGKKVAWLLTVWADRVWVYVTFSPLCSLSISTRRARVRMGSLRRQEPIMSSRYSSMPSSCSVWPLGFIMAICSTSPYAQVRTTNVHNYPHKTKCSKTLTPIICHKNIHSLLRI